MSEEKKPYAVRCLETHFYRERIRQGEDLPDISGLAKAMNEVDPNGDKAFEIALRLRDEYRSGKRKQILF